MVFTGELAKRLKVVFQEIAERYEFKIDTMEVINCLKIVLT